MYLVRQGLLGGQQGSGRHTTKDASNMQSILETSDLSEMLSLVGKHNDHLLRGLLSVSTTLEFERCDTTSPDFGFAHLAFEGNILDNGNKSISEGRRGILVQAMTPFVLNRQNTYNWMVFLLLYVVNGL